MQAIFVPVAGVERKNGVLQPIGVGTNRWQFPPNRKPSFPAMLVIAATPSDFGKVSVTGAVRTKGGKELHRLTMPLDVPWQTGTYTNFATVEALLPPGEYDLVLLLDEKPAFSWPIEIKIE